MKKLNIVFTALVALLLFLVSLNTFNKNYSVNQSVFKAEKLVNGDTHQLNTMISTHVLDVDIKELKNRIVEFYEGNEYEGFISHVTINENMEKSASVYAYFDHTDDLFQFHTIPSEDNIKFKSRTENRTITNVIGQANAILIDYLDSDYYEYRDDYDRQFMNILPLNHLLSSDDSKLYNTQISIYLYVDENNIEQARKDLTQDLLIPLGVISEGTVETSEFILDSTQVSTDSLTKLSLFGDKSIESIFQMPNSLLIISAITALLVNVYVIVSQVKEIYVRRVHGNSEGLIFYRINSKQFYANFAVFILTFVILWIIHVHSFRPLAIVFIKQLCLIIALYGLLMVLVAGFLFAYFHLRNSIVYLKKQHSMSSLFITSTVIKVIGVTIVTITLALSLNTWNQNKEAVKVIENDPTYLKSVGLQGVTQAIYPQLDGEMFTKIQKWEAKYREDIEKFIVSQSLSFIDMDYYAAQVSYSDEAPIYPFGLTNLTHVENYPMTQNSSMTNFSDHEENFIIIPEKSQDSFENEGIQIDGFENSPTYFVDSTFTQFSNYVGHHNHYVDPVLYVIVDDYSVVNEFYNSLRKVINNNTEGEAFQKELLRFNRDVAQIPKLNSQDVYAQVNDKEQQSKVSFYILLATTLFIVSLFSYLMSYSFIESRKKDLSTKYFHGHSVIKRYGWLFITQALSILTIIVFIQVYNGSLDYWELDYLSVKSNSLRMIMVMLITIDVIVSSVVINTFHTKNVASILKGEGN
ncbi:hypothetical protein ERUR111494_08140 [Erysipelothrix urinaevulpis]|uniref:hypothetical protein n=1 Tax=Erysipelothrix urinaevulpis TaxID=2683717 RepID=UPI00135878BF|nr:hypothetical protein [Erysipelothrix urinaevulpis]